MRDFNKSTEVKCANRWLAAVKTKNVDDLLDMLDSHIEMSPPFQEEKIIGKKNVLKTFKIFDQIVKNFHYFRVITDKGVVILEFEGEIGKIKLQGMDLMIIDDRQKIVAIKVMLRPLEALLILNEAMKK